MTLIELQRDMRGWLTREDGAAVARLGGEAVASGLGVYQNNFRAQILACLAESFAHTRAWIGGEAFRRAVVTHVERVPPSSWTLDAYPRDFPATLAALYPDDPEVAELAWIELALAEAFVGADAVPLTAEDVGGVDWDRAVLCLIPTLEIGARTTNAAAIWSALVEGSEPPAAVLLDEAGAVLVWRDGEAPRFRTIDQIEHQAVLAARGGMPFAALCDALVQLLGEQAGVQRAGEMLGLWLADGMIVRVV